MKRRWISLLTALALAVGVCAAEPLSGAAASLGTDEEGSKEQCSLTIYLPNDDNEFADDLGTENVVVDLYLIARAVTDEYGMYTFKVEQGYEKLKIPDEGEDWTAEDSEALAQQAAEITLTENASVTTKKIGQEVGTKISGLDAGLYLLVARGRNLTSLSDYMVELTQTNSDTNENTTKIATIANSERYTYYFSPQLVSLPSKKPEDGVINTANPSEWNFNLTVNLKPEQQPRYGSLEIIKKLTEFETMAGTDESATFVFEVKWTLGNEEYSEVEAITFTKAGQESVTLKRIPVGAEVTVTEVYSGSSYELTVKGDRTAVIEADKTAEVKFTNEYDGRRTNGHGIRNHFQYGDNKWDWTSGPGQDTTGNVESQTEE